ncbi:hypothetical protein KAFR_0A05760 [Kazachstania africana CBS 2517]|uniref:Vacuolar protein-sorting-associated protein 36 n=1 Tax=Kazachstania africana (strain ATCC 22294 / BCRC 22015 / CBS 2517 / CECT 1963 / NBRC 1671 / NRRL Y-8276) TaxID=1071382 RepID=H2ANR1_KAZAF|nr:hypothetical protein KAFR_0A05760 [Kazachstania africana CBS 2517]CCF56011.1 hypothetical protein KAFR_0A05760 [Kazachstania africana CBS 2517]
MEYCRYIETSRSGQPTLRENENDILIDYSVGLYSGKLKQLDKQDGRVFLTSQRLIYVDNKLPVSNSIFLELDNIESIDYNGSFLKKSPKIIIFLKKRNSEKDKKTRNVNSLWKCPICQSDNILNGIKLSMENAKEQGLVCNICGVPLDFSLIKDSLTYSKPSRNSSHEDSICPACTFMNHPDLTNCEICGTRLKKQAGVIVSDSKKPLFIQLSFRRSDGTLFYQALTNLLKEIKHKDVFNKNATTINGVLINEREKEKLAKNSNFAISENKMDLVGISGLEKSRENQLLNNDILFNNALTDMNNLMSLVDKIQRLYRNKDYEIKVKPSLIIDREKFFDKDYFMDEIAREIYEFAILEFQNDGNVMITLVDLYAMYNKTMRIGTGLISPQEMKEACERFTKLGLEELKLMKINNRVLCLSSVNSFEVIKSKIIKFVEDCPGSDVLKINQHLNPESQANSNWTMGVIAEILQDCMDSEKLVIDEQLSGIHYYKNNSWL